MILFLGILIFVLPFVLVFLFQNRIKGFAYVLIFGTSFHLLVSVCTQYFGVFIYTHVLRIYVSAICLIIITFFIKKGKVFNFKIDIFVVLAFSIIFFQFWSIHYNYTGTIRTFSTIEEVKNSSYSFPMFSDEWIAASLSEYSIKEGKLPIVNPLNDNKPFLNLLFVFHSALAAFFILLGLNPVSQFAIAAIVGGIGVCVSAFILLKSLEVHSRIASITILLLPFISQAGNLPGLWFILPYTVGLIFLLLFFTGLTYKDSWMYVPSSILSILFYPPIIVFILPAYVMYFIKNIFTVMILFGLTLPPIIFSETVRSKIFRSNLDGGIISFPIWYVIPFIVFPFIFIALYRTYGNKKLYLFVPVIAGLLYWVFYKFYPEVIIIEYPRIVIITSVLLVTLSGVGIEIFKEKILKTNSILIILVIFFILAIFYPIGNNWENFQLYPLDQKTSAPITPFPPVMHYITQEDILLFKDIQLNKFIAPPWKGLVLGVATDNDPLESKSSTITTNILSYKKFMDSNCKEKMRVVKRYKVSYVYSAYIDCNGFTLLHTSAEGLHLYGVN